MSSYGSSAPASVSAPVSVAAPPSPATTPQLRVPVPPQSGRSRPVRRSHGLGAPSHWALAVAVLLAAILAGLLWSGSGVDPADLPAEALRSIIGVARQLLPAVG